MDADLMTGYLFDQHRASRFGIESVRPLCQGVVLCLLQVGIGQVGIVKFGRGQVGAAKSGTAKVGVPKEGLV